MLKKLLLILLSLSLLSLLLIVFGCSDDGGNGPQTLENTALKLHKMINEGITPKPEFSKKCKQCSLIDKCMPEVFSKKKSISYLKKIFEAEE